MGGGQLLGNPQINRQSHQDNGTATTKDLKQGKNKPKEKTKKQDLNKNENLQLRKLEKEKKVKKKLTPHKVNVAP